MLKIMLINTKKVFERKRFIRICKWLANKEMVTGKMVSDINVLRFEGKQNKNKSHVTREDPSGNRLSWREVVVRWRRKLRGNLVWGGQHGIGNRLAVYVVMLTFYKMGRSGVSFALGQPMIIIMNIFIVSK